MRDFSKLSAKDAAYNEVLGAKHVKVKADRTCRKCGKTISKGETCLTASRLIDKKYNKTYRYIVDSNKSTQSFSFVQQRYHMCEDCANNLIIKRPKLLSKYMDTEEYDKLSYEEQLDIAVKAFRNKELTASEFQDIENNLIDAMAFRDALADEY